jgi:hypothetical protein
MKTHRPHEEMQSSHLQCNIHEKEIQLETESHHAKDNAV